MTAIDARRPLSPGSRRLSFWRVFGPRKPYDSELDTSRATALAALSVLLAGMGIAAGALLMALRGPSAPLSYMLLSAGASCIAVFIAVRRGSLRAARVAFVLLGLAAPGVLSIPLEVIPPELAALAYIIPVIAAAFLIGIGWSAATLAAAVVLLAGSVYVQHAGSPEALAGALRFEEGAALVIFGRPALLLALAALLGWAGLESLSLIALRADRRAAQLEAAVVVTEVAAEAPSLRSLLNDVVDRIRDVYGFYHAQVFLLDDEGQMARLEASTGRAGEALLARGHALAVGSQSVIGMCTASGQPVVVNNTSASSIHRPNELLPDTRAELALPLRVGGTVIGALDAQSTQAGAFQPHDVRSLEIMAAQLAAAIDKARLVDTLQARVAENERLVEETRSALAQLDELNRRLTREGWHDYLSVRHRETLGYTLDGDAVREDASWTPVMERAATSVEAPVVSQMNGMHTVALPLMVRGEVIGVLEFERRGGRGWSSAELELAGQLVERLAQAVESARLYEQARLATVREQVVNQIGQEIQAAHSIDEVLQAALAELGEVLGASHGVVQISPQTGEPPVTAAHTGA